MKHLITLTKVLSAIAVVFGAFEANAISLRYKFKVESSGPRMYACNAGIMAQTSNNRICYFEGTKNKCTPTDCSDADTKCDSSCVCSSTNGGDYLMNYGKLKWVGQSPMTGEGDKTFRGTNTSSYSQAFTDEEAWGRRITDLSFHLGSELYSAKYFVDICYNGPQIEYYEDQVATTFTLLKAQAYAIDALFKGKVPGENSRAGMVMGKGDYTKLANLKVEAYMVCDRQGVGQYVYARNLNGDKDTLDNEASFVFGGNATPVGAAEAPTSFFASSPIMLTGQTANLLIDKIITNNDGKAPRHCKVRYVFTETNWSSATAQLRKWESHGAEMCTYTEIAEPPGAR